MDDVNESMEFRFRPPHKRIQWIIFIGYILLVVFSSRIECYNVMMERINYENENQRLPNETPYRLQPIYMNLTQFDKQSQDAVQKGTVFPLFITKYDAITTENTIDSSHKSRIIENAHFENVPERDPQHKYTFYAKDARLLVVNANNNNENRFYQQRPDVPASRTSQDDTQFNLDTFSRMQPQSQSQSQSQQHGQFSSHQPNPFMRNHDRNFINSNNMPRGRFSHRKFCIKCQIIPGEPIRNRNKSLMPTRIFDCRCNPLGSISRACNKYNGQCVCRKNVVGLICDRCADGFWQLDSENGCQHCACNEMGSSDLNCNAHTGQCNCKSGVSGHKCDKCDEGFYGFSSNGCKPCESCSNPAFNCDPETGRCVCPSHSKGIDCSQCMPNSYGHVHKKGCKLCDCDHGGSIGQSCDLYTGQCVCREGFTGRRCDECSIGFFDYPRCERCNCNRDGSHSQMNASAPIPCDNFGQCSCKASVTGLKCDTCIPTTYGLSKYNSDGCSNCFCFGRSTDCTQSNWSWGVIRATDIRCLSVEYQNLEFVTIQTVSKDQFVSYEANLSTAYGLSMIPGTTGNVSIGSTRGFDVPLYFELPKKFLGDRLLSYSGLFKFSIEMMDCKTELDELVLQQFPLIRIYAHNSLILDYFGPEIYEKSPNISYSLRFTEKNWRYNGQTVERDLFMIALQNITHILVRATTSVAFNRLILSNITLETAIYLSGAKNNLAIGIEICNCPEGTDGTSCQNSAKGYYRYKPIVDQQETIEDFIGQSIPCNCNGRSNLCDVETGYCEMCANNTGGSTCDICADGYYGSPNDYGCEPCPCPTTQQNFAKGCTFLHGRVRCACKPGYEGDLCELCASGYYENSEEFEGGCISCECNEHGTISMECDIKSGACSCKPGVAGRRCDRCEQPRSSLKDGSCQVCDNCTLTLLESSDDLGYMIANETNLIDLDGVPAPWPRVLMFENSTKFLTRKLADVIIAKEKVDNYNDLQIDKLNTKAANTVAKWQKLLSKALKRINVSDNLKNDSMQILNEIHHIQDDTEKEISHLNLLGINNHQINFPMALSEAKSLLQNILEEVHNQNGAFRAHQCANTLIDQWSKISDILNSQMDEAQQMKYEIINSKNRLYDLTNNVYETSKILTNAEAIKSISERGFEKLKHKLKKITHLRNNLTDIFNTSVIPETDVLFNIIDDNHEKIKQDLSNLIQLKTTVQETNAQNAQQIKNLRSEWVPRAQSHSTDLSNRAREYVQLFENTKNSAEAAMLASTAYKNISDSISIAHQLVVEAKKLALDSERELYPKQEDSVIEKCMKSLKKSHKIHQNAMREIEKLEDLEFVLNGQKRKVDSIKNSIWQTGLRNNNISLALNTFSKNDTQDFLRKTIDTANELSEEMREVRRGAISVMSSDVYKLKLKLATLEPQWAVKFGLAQENVSQSMRNIKDIRNTLSTIESLSARNDERFRKWNQSMSVMMQDLKDKITKARHIAEGIRVSMESQAKCVRSYLPPSFGLYTSNTIKFSIALKTKSITSSILFLQGEDNRFLAIEMVKRKIRFAWNLGGDTASVTHSFELSKKDLEYDEAWYRIEVNRTMNVGSLTVRQMGTEIHKPPVTVSSASQPEFTRIIFTAANRLWVGGVPNDSRPPGLIAHDAGLNVVLSNIYIDNKEIGLWNFMHTEGECDGAMFGARDATMSTNIRHFNGQGYSVVKKERSKPYKKNFFALQMLFKTFDENALLLLAIDEKNKRSLSVSLSSGKIVVQINYSADSRLEINTTKKYNNGQWTSIEFAREFITKRSTENGSLKVNNEEPLTGSPTSPITSSLLPDFSRAAYYFGGVPPGYEFIAAKAPGTDHAFLGCLKDIQINGENYDPLETSVRHGVEASCKETITRAGFHGNGYVELPNHSLKKRANIGFVFRTLQPDTLIMLADIPQAEIGSNYFDDKDLRSNYSFLLTAGRLIFWADAGRGRIELMSNNTLNDGEYHTVNMLKIGRKFELRIDDEFQMSKSLTIHPFVINMIEDVGGLYVGGVPDNIEVSHTEKKLNRFQGTIKDFVINNHTISFSNVVNFMNVDIGRDGPKMGTGHRYNDILMKTEPVIKHVAVNQEGCHRFGAYSYETNAFKFGDAPQSYSVVSVAKNLLQKDFEIQFDFRTYYPNGLLFVVPGAKEKKKHFFTLILRNGQMNVVVRGRKRVEAIMARKLNDGQWHRVSLKNTNKQLTIRIHSENQSSAVDEEWIKMPKRINVSNMMYVGGMIDNLLSFELTAKLDQFKGCIRRFILNNSPQDLAKPERHSGIGQCFPNVEKGSYFAGDAYATYKRIFHVGKFLELRFEFRTSELNGVILSVAEPVGFPALSIELHKGKIVMSCDLGDGNPFRIESNLSSKFALCDNKWHNISAIYDSNQIAIRVDDLQSVTKLKQHDSLSKVHTKSPLYIGGIPETASSGTLLSRENFKGCIRNVVIRNELKDWTDMDDLQNVLLSECLTESS